MKDEPAFDALATLAALAALTERARLGRGGALRQLPAGAARRQDGHDPGRHLRRAAWWWAWAPARTCRSTAPTASRSRRPRERTEAPARRAGGDARDVRAPRGRGRARTLAGAPNQPPPVQPGGPPIWLAAHRPAAAAAGRRARRRHRGRLRRARGGGAPPGRGRGGAPRGRAAAARLRALHVRAAGLVARARPHAWLAPEAGRPRHHARRAAALAARHRHRRRRPASCATTLAAHGGAGVTDAVLVLPSRVPPEALDALAEATLPAAPPPPSPAPAARGRAEDNLVDLLVERHAEGGLGRPPGGRRRRRAPGRFAELSAASARAAGALRGGRGAPRRPGGRGPARRPPVARGVPRRRAARRGAGAPRPGGRRRAPRRDPATTASPPPWSAIARPPSPACGWSEPAALDDGAPRAGRRRSTPRTSATSSTRRASTGRPKGAMHAHRDMRAGIETYAREVLALAPGDRCHSMARLFTSLGFGNGFFRVLGSGATAVLLGRCPAHAARGAGHGRRAHGVTVLTGRAHLLVAARPLPRAPSRRRTPSRRCGWPSPPATACRPSVAERLRAGDGDRPDRGARLLGVLEHRHLDPARRAAARARSDAPVAGVEIRLADDGGRPGGARAAGAPVDPQRLQHHRLLAPRGRDPRAGVRARGCAWATCCREEDGVYRHLGRSDDLFKVDARWVSPAEVEAALLTHPAVAEAAVVGRAGRRRARRRPRGLRGAGARRRATPRTICAGRRCAATWPARCAAPQGASERDGAGGAPASALGQARPPQAPRGLSRRRRTAARLRPARPPRKSSSSSLTRSGTSCCTQWLTPGRRSTRSGPVTVAADRSSSIGSM